VELEHPPQQVLLEELVFLLQLLVRLLAEPVVVAVGVTPQVVVELLQQMEAAHKT
jgi:hypothetical protein